MKSGAGSFLTSFATSYQGAQDRKNALAREERDDARRTEDRDFMRENRDYDRRTAVAAGGGAGGGGQGGTGDSWGSNAEPFRSSDPVNTSLAPYQRAFLNSVAGGESAGVYNVRYSPDGGQNFDLSGGHPRIFEPGPHGKSSAAGRYQFTWTTWKDVAGKDTPFTAENQDAYAWQLADERYRALTGRNLGDVLQRDGLTNEVMETLTPTWQAFKGNRARWSSTYTDSLARLSGTPGTPARRSTANPAAALAPALSFGMPAPPQARRSILPTQTQPGPF